jgi:type I restriction enzyme S subunit
MAAKTNWSTRKLGDLAEFRNGVNYNKSSFGEGIKVVGVSDFQDYTKPRYADLDQINPQGIVTERNILHDGDIVFVRSNGNRELIGRSLLIQQPPEEVTHSAFTIRLRFTSREVDPRFYAYCFRTPLIRKALAAYGGGTNISNLNQDILGTLEVPFPPRPVQQRIAGILSVYDDLMENNLRRIRILEEMARALYREWFVNFRFSGHEKIPRVLSPLGDIPQGWELRRFPECVDINPRVVVARDGEHQFVPMGSLANGSMLITDIEARLGNSGAKFQNGDTLFARITPCLENGKTGFVQFLPDRQSVACGSTEFIVLRSRTLTPEFVYLLARSDKFRGNAIKSMSGASGRQRVQEKCFDRFQIVQPPRDLLDRFSAVVAPSFRLIQELHLQTQTLRRTRDLLLPRLLSGQVNLETH